MFKIFPRKENSKKSQDRKNNPKSVKVIACNKCHCTNITLYRGPDSYYCSNCLNKIRKEQNNV